MNHVRKAAIAAMVGYTLGRLVGCVPAIGAEEASFVPDGTGEALRVRWEHTYPEMEDNFDLEVAVVGPARLREMWLELGQEIPSGGIVMGYSQIFTYTFAIKGRPDYLCKVFLSFSPKIDSTTLDHEMRHCNGWTHPVWTSENMLPIGAEE